MNADKIRNLTDAELTHQQTELADQLFKLKFQLKMGQTESLKKIRDLKKDIARMYTIQREKQIAGGNGAQAVQAAPAAPKKIKTKPVVEALKAKKAAAPKAKKTATAKKAATKKSAATEKK
jgi:large subunit ribosomal protein L29